MFFFNPGGIPWTPCLASAASRPSNSGAFLEREKYFQKTIFVIIEIEKLSGRNPGSFAVLGRVRGGAEREGGFNFDPTPFENPRYAPVPVESPLFIDLFPTCFFRNLSIYEIDILWIRYFSDTWPADFFKNIDLEFNGKKQ